MSRDTFVRLQLISGQYVCQSAHHGSPIVEVEMIGIPADCAKHKSKVVTRNTVNPIWNEFYTFKVRLSRYYTVVCSRMHAASM